MENLEKYKNRIKSITELANKMDNGSLTIEELLNLETLTRELHERSVILKYKAFEDKIKPAHEGPLNIEDEVDFIEQPVEYNHEVEESEPAIDFSIFDNPSSEEVGAPAEEETVEVRDTPPISDTTIESAADEKVIAEPLNEGGQLNASSFWEQLNIKDNSLSTQFEGAKIDTLVGAFGLNEKLRFINDLFDGSSESFSEAIKILDAQSNIDEAKIKSAELAGQHNWDAEEESVVDFMVMVNRRYA